MMRFRSVMSGNASDNPERVSMRRFCTWNGMFKKCQNVPHLPVFFLAEMLPRIVRSERPLIRQNQYSMS